MPRAPSAQPPPVTLTLCPPLGGRTGDVGDTGEVGAARWECSWWALPPGAAAARPGSALRAWLVVLAGRCVLRIGEDTLLVGPGDTFVIPPGEAYRLTAGAREAAQLLDVVEAPGTAGPERMAPAV